MLSVTEGYFEIRWCNKLFFLKRIIMLNSLGRELRNFFQLGIQAFKRLTFERF